MTTDLSKRPRTKDFPLLAGISCPRALRAVPADRVPQLAAQIRDFLVERCVPRAVIWARTWGR